MSDLTKIKTTLRLTVGMVIFALFNDLKGIWNGEAVEFDADHDTVAEHAVIVGREDLLPLLAHQRMVEMPEPDNPNNPRMMQVVYTPQGKPVFQEIPNDLEAANEVISGSPVMMRGDERLMTRAEWEREFVIDPPAELFDEMRDVGTTSERPAAYAAVNDGLAVRTADGVQMVEAENSAVKTDGADAVEFAENAGVFLSDVETNDSMKSDSAEAEKESVADAAPPVQEEKTDEVKIIEETKTDADDAPKAKKSKK